MHTFYLWTKSTTTLNYIHMGWIKFTSTHVHSQSLTEWVMSKKKTSEATRHRHNQWINWDSGICKINIMMGQLWILLIYLYKTVFAEKYIVFTLTTKSIFIFAMSYWVLIFDGHGVSCLFFYHNMLLNEGELSVDIKISMGFTKSHWYMHYIMRNHTAYFK